jgi:glycosyltransferase involved in cell wall biosynthesis
MTANQPPSQPLRVLVNGIHAKSGGGLSYLRALLPLLAADGRLSLTLLIHRKQRELFQPLPAGIAVEMIDLAPGQLRELVWEQLRLPGLARRLGAEMVFSPANFGPLAIRSQVIVLHNDVSVAKFETRLSKKVYWAALKALTLMSLARVRRAVAVSAYAADRLSFGHAALRRKIAVVHHGVVPAFAPDPSVPREGFVLAVSDIYVQKNLHTLVRALALLPGVELRVAGQVLDGWYHAEIVRQAEALGVADRIRFLGRVGVDDLVALYRRCAAFVFPSTVETFGMPLAEAMACGAPIACSNSAAMPEVVGDGAALLFNPLDDKDMAEAIGRLLADRPLAAALGARAQERARDFSWPRAARAVADVLVDAAGRK